MSKLFKNLKSIFVIEGEDTGSGKRPVAKPEAKKGKDEAESQVKSTPDKPAIQVANVGEGKVNQKFTDILLKAIESNNQEGFDYIEFKRSLQNLFKMNLPEETMYKSAYAAAQTMGATPQGLLSSAERYLEVLQQEQDKFAAAIKNQRAKQIDGRVAEMGRISEGIKQKQAKIAELEAEIDAAQKKLAKVEGSIEAAAAKVEKTGRDFEASYGNLVGQIRSDMENIKKHLAQ